MTFLAFVLQFDYVRKFRTRSSKKMCRVRDIAVIDAGLRKYGVYIVSRCSRMLCPLFVWVALRSSR